MLENEELHIELVLGPSSALQNLLAVSCDNMALIIVVLITGGRNLGVNEFRWYKDRCQHRMECLGRISPSWGLGEGFLPDTSSVILTNLW
jgi:hypothetical protein